MKGTGILQRDPDILMLDVEVNGERVALVRSAGGERNRWPAIDGDLRELDPF